ncbi:putative acyl-CoA thioester hydrolase [Blattamonas nauphoetae]|uniref:Acyl-CoA thioester hydrolase n=1 Tax=Blattamonas nauphoetae TaxID=2049346 RepID=A0ABQ9XZA4_9EUKA|nr:putative acyl-CoA thioester hydrolase [Blattamonas nauphoetae]
MSYFPRVAWNIFCGKFLDKDNPVDVYEHTWKSRVGLSDIDMFLHVNNAQYLQLCELARWTFMTRGKLLASLGRLGMNPVVTEVSCRYRRQLRLGTRYEIHSKLIHFTQREFYMVQTFNYSGGLAARVLLKVQVLKKGEVQNPLDVWKDIDPNQVTPQLDPNSEDYKAIFHFYALESYLLGKPLPSENSPSPIPAPSPVR